MICSMGPPGTNLHDDEGEQHHAQQGGDHQQQAFEDIGAHQVFEIVFAASASYHQIVG